MESRNLLWNLASFLCIFFGPACLTDKIRILHGKRQCLQGRIGDLESVRVYRGKKRKRDDDVSDWITKGQKLVKAVQCASNQVSESTKFLKRAKIIRDLDKLIDQLTDHEMKASGLLGLHSPDNGSRRHCTGLPVKDLIGQVATNALNELAQLIRDPKVRGILIYGKEGMGKTTLMKHLYNSVTYLVHDVFWVTSPDPFNIKALQEAVASAVRFNLPNHHDLNVRAKPLAHRLSSLGRCVLFLDGVPAANFTLEQVRIPVFESETGCKVVLTTSADSNCIMLDFLERFELVCLPQDEAFKLFMRELQIGEKFLSELDDIPGLLVDECHGVPGKIVDLATRLCGIHNLQEWRNALYETISLGAET